MQDIALYAFSHQGLKEALVAGVESSPEAPAFADSYLSILAHMRFSSSL
jgi:hypothetical protein